MEGRSKQERIKVRKQLGSLKSLTVQPSTRKRYNNALNDFFAWLKEEHLEIPRKKEHMDGLVAEYLEWLWSSGEGKGKANDTVAALQDFDPKLKGKFWPFPLGCLLWSPPDWGGLKFSCFRHYRPVSHQTSGHFIRTDKRREADRCS